MRQIENNLITFSTSLTGDHLSLAMEAYYDLQDSKDHRKKSAISTILHSFCGLESAVNLIGFEIFFNKESQRYIEESKRDFALKRMVKSWNASIACLDKIDLILSINSASLEGRLRNELTELNTIRNWISHGFPYKTTWLVEPDKEDNTKGTVVDFEYSVNWKQKFPNTKFNALDALDITDAEKTLKIVFEILIKISKATNDVFHVVTYNDGGKYKLIHKGSTVDSIIKREK
ncbi:hypothetical protein [Flavobacterium nitrogenifigens]|uniref:RiboL-PSP-HEPN domain-containing protein n=1 Tax=Flavobacterium nitrogenifigens TaxID=1617283 RepID=A0A521DVE0_9FLAO|nr:hypothetical protein [Flavobacterium nitrogenifigens]KAF2327604.1 hypothetical protein DM397_19485 [Flavobacterium nitrogenifigens]SMO75562.1 hypothetical protein SAMN06265220_103509 [Flavobacterium nitrogenifigens]